MVILSRLLTRFRPVWRTLRFRLTIWNAVVVAGMSLLLLIGVRHGVRWALYHELDQLLQEDLQELEMAVKATPEEDFEALTEELERKAKGHRQHGWFAELFDSRGTLVWSSAQAPVQGLPPPDQLSPVPYSRQKLRISEQQLRQPSLHGIHQLRVGARLDSLSSDMAHIDRLIYIAAGFLLVVAPVCGYWLAGRAARTVGEIIHTASRLRPSHLEERLSLRGTGDELDELAVTINHLLDRIGAYLQQKRDFLANAAHELRTPLAAIRSSVEVALSGELTSDEYSNLLADIIGQSTALETLVNQLLLISETETDQWKHRQELVSVHEILRRATDMFQGVAEAKGLELEVDQLDAAWVTGSRHHLRQVVNNLIDNAVKYTLEGGHIKLVLQRGRDEGTLRLAVHDTGIGISSEDLPFVFDRFFRSDRSRTRGLESHGTGLGLSICHAVVTAHGGTIRCESELHRGTTVEVILPLAAVEVPDLLREPSTV